ncbi:MAG: non-homologous end-joining DNA ligase [Actinomycetota bacterium]
MKEIDSAQPSQTIEVLGRSLSVSNPNRILWPEVRFTKGQMVDYYRAIAPVLLPHLADRPIVLARFPAGVNGEYWYQTECPNPPDWLATCRIAKAGDPAQTFDYCVLQDEASLVWAANLGAIELHPLLARVGSLDRPSAVVFDVDPGPGVGMGECCSIALMLRARLAVMDLSCHPKLSGSRGLHLYLPLNSPATHDGAKAFARALAEEIVREHPDLVTAKRERASRSGKVLIDWAQNGRLRNLVAPYSLRAMPLPSVAAPLSWDEVESIAHQGAHVVTLLPSDVRARVEATGDLLEPVLTQRQRLPDP